MIKLLILAVVLQYIPSTDLSVMPYYHTIYTEPQITESSVMFYDIPMSKELQEYTYDLCLEYRIPYELVVAMIKCESDFRSKCVGDGDYGIMQINWYFHEETFYESGYDNVFNPYQNIAYGINYFAEFYHEYGEHAALMCYNMGETRYLELSGEGITSSEYSRKVVEYKEELLLVRYNGIVE